MHKANLCKRHGFVCLKLKLLKWELLTFVIQHGPEHLQGWGIHILSGQSVSVPHQPLSEELRVKKREVRAIKSRELWGLWTAQNGTSSQLALGTGTKRGKGNCYLFLVVLGPSTLQRWLQWESLCLEGDLHPFLHTSKSAAQPLHPNLKGKSRLLGHLYGKANAFSINFSGVLGTSVSCLHIPQGRLQPMKELPGDWHSHYWICKGSFKEGT